METQSMITKRRKKDYSHTCHPGAFIEEGFNPVKSFAALGSVSEVRGRELCGAGLRGGGLPGSARTRA
jgi:hypothetical protein